jgi:glycine cleavage system regulatory protein
MLTPVRVGLASGARLGHSHGWHYPGGMKATLVLTLIGLDKPGLVKAISDTAARHAANWEASRMARLGGRFAGLLLVTLEPDRAEALQRDLEALSELGLKVVVERSAQVEARRDWQTVRLDLLGTDQVGIMRNVAATLSDLGINVDDLSTECSGAPISGGDLFKLSALLACPPSVSMDQLKAELERVANDLMVDIQLEDAGLAR